MVGYFCSPVYIISLRFFVILRLDCSEFAWQAPATVREIAER